MKVQFNRTWNLTFTEFMIHLCTLMCPRPCPLWRLLEVTVMQRLAKKIKRNKMLARCQKLISTFTIFDRFAGCIFS